MSQSTWETTVEQSSMDALAGAPPVVARASLESPSANATALHEIARLESRVDRLLLVTRSIWILLQEQTGLTDEQLMKLVDHLDTRDGTRDGRQQRSATKCSKCEAVVSPKYNRCLFCGEPGAVETLFDAV